MPAHCSTRTAPADLVVASYVINELSDAERAALVDALWVKTTDTLLIVEPGTPAGYARIIAARTQLIAAGAHVAAPCPHDQPCPLIAPDWCHFVQRLARSRAHKQVKDVDVPFEDEKFIYLALTRAPVARPAARVLAPPVVTKVGGHGQAVPCRRHAADRRHFPPRQAGLRRGAPLELG